MSMLSLSLVSTSRQAGPIVLDLTKPESLEDLKKNREWLQSARGGGTEF